MTCPNCRLVKYARVSPYHCSCGMLHQIITLPITPRPNYPAISTRNLIYHIYPQGDWEGIVSEIAAYRHIFNGKCVVAIASGSPEVCKKVKKLLRPTQLLTFKNDPQLREQVSFLPLLSHVLNDSPTEATFYAHTKANSTADNVYAATLWRRVMVRNLLGKSDKCMEHLQHHTFVGTHKMIWPSHAPTIFPTGLTPKHLWMHCGTFWWFRHDIVSQLHTPDTVVKDRYGVEAWPAQLVPHTEAYSMWQPWEESERAYPQLPHPYDPVLYHRAGIFE